MSGTEAPIAVQAAVTLVVLATVGGLSWILIRPRLQDARRRRASFQSALAAIPPAYRPQRPPTREAATMASLVLGAVGLALVKPHAITVAVAIGAMALSIIWRSRIERRRRRRLRAELRQIAPSLGPVERAELMEHLKRVYALHDFRELTRDV